MTQCLLIGFAQQLLFYCFFHGHKDEERSIAVSSHFTVKVEIKLDSVTQANAQIYSTGKSTDRGNYIEMNCFRSQITLL